MKRFKEIFGKVMVNITASEAAIVGIQIPVVHKNTLMWVEFTDYANLICGSNLECQYSYWTDSSHCCVEVKVTSFNEKSAAALNSNGITEWSIMAEDDFDDDGRPLGTPALYLKIPCNE